MFRSKIKIVIKIFILFLVIYGMWIDYPFMGAYLDSGKELSFTGFDALAGMFGFFGWLIICAAAILIPTGLVMRFFIWVFSSDK